MEFAFLVFVVGGSIYLAWWVPGYEILQLPLLQVADFFVLLAIFSLSVYFIIGLIDYLSLNIGKFEDSDFEVKK